MKKRMFTNPFSFTEASKSELDLEKRRQQRTAHLQVYLVVLMLLMLLIAAAVGGPGLKLALTVHTTQTLLALAALVIASLCAYALSRSEALSRWIGSLRT